LTKIANLQERIRALEKNKKVLKQQIGTLKRDLTRLRAHREKLWTDIHAIKDLPFNKLLQTLHDMGELVSVRVNGRNITLVDAILLKSGEPFVLQSQEGFYQDPTLNKGRTAHFYFSPKLKPSIISKIEKLGKTQFITAKNVKPVDECAVSAH